LPGGGGGVSARSWLTGGVLPSTLLCVDKFRSRRDAAKDYMAAWLSMADHLEMRAAMTDRWRSAGACLALDWASNRMKFVARYKAIFFPPHDLDTMSTVPVLTLSLLYKHFKTTEL
jgi:hypothetical protein